MKIFIFTILLLAFTISAFAQTNAEIERELIAGVKEIKKYGTYGDGYDEEKLPSAQNAFETKLLKYTKTAETLQYKFNALSQEMYIATSDDGRFRIYSWDLEDGGTMHDFRNVYQYQGTDGKIYSQADKKSTVEDGGAGSFVYDIFSLDTKSGKIYIACSTFIGSTNDHYQSAGLYKIKGGTLDGDVKLIKTKSGLSDSLGFEYNFFSVVDREERPVKLILFDKKTKTLKIPVVIEDKEFPNGRVTNKFISYRFDGTYFVKVS